MYKSIKEEIYSQNLKEKIKALCNKCMTCQRNKPFRNNYGQLKNYIITKEPKEVISTDLLEPIIHKNYTNEKRWYVLTITDIFTRMTRLYLVKNITSKEIINKFNLIIKKEFIPKKIIADRGKQYSSKEFLEFCTFHGIKLQLNTPYTPTANGISERLNSSVLNVITMYQGSETMSAAL